MKKISLLASKIALFSLLALSFAPATIFITASDASAQSTSATSNQGADALGGGTTETVAADANQNALATVMCNVLKVVTGNAGKAFAAFAIISVGIGFFTGKLSWGLMIGVVAGIAAMFGAASIVSAISGRSAYNCKAN